MRWWPFVVTMMVPVGLMGQRPTDGALVEERTTHTGRPSQLASWPWSRSKPLLRNEAMVVAGSRTKMSRSRVSIR